MELRMLVTLGQPSSGSNVQHQSLDIVFSFNTDNSNKSRGSFTRSFVILQHYNFPFQFVIVLDHPLFTKYKPVCLGSQSCCCLFTHVVHQGQTRAADSSNLRKTLFEENPTNSSGRECSVIDNRLAEDKNRSQSNLSSVTTLIPFIRLNQTKATNRTNHLPTSFSKVSKVK